MNRRNFLLNFSLWILYFIFGYRISNYDIKIGVLGGELSENEKNIWADAKKDFGATGDGFTDDSIAIQNALNSLTSGGTLFIPDGTYIISAKLIAPPNTTVRGAGINRTFIHWDTNNSTLNWMLEFSQNNSIQWSAVSDLTLNHKREERGLQDSQAYGGIHACSRLMIERVRIHNTSGPGITQGAIEDIKIRDCEIYDTGHHGIYFSSSDGTFIKNVEIRNNYIGSPGTLAAGRLLGAHLIKFRFDTSTHVLENISIKDNKMECGVNGEGIFISTTEITDNTDCLVSHLTIANNMINYKKEVTTMTSGVYIGNNSKGKNVRITNNLIYGSGIADSYGVRTLFSNFNLTDNVIIRQNKIDNCETGVYASKAWVSENHIMFSKYGLIGNTGKAFNNFFESVTDGAIAIRQAINFDIVENTINMQGVSTIGIEMGNSTNLIISRNKITGAVEGIKRSSKSLKGCIFSENIFILCVSNYVSFTDSASRIKDNIFIP
ncbi:glycosyl hydrolase family 28-related protein [Peribacillus frigoritolerans]|uniref:glycosyl hydrolase family 28-related protein n=1 Tax=Peribacillus frigoritolerans TaxID=450367 RepID=UPI003CFC52B8